eukprot:492222-Pyramimonas_sp.AAC.1
MSVTTTTCAPVPHPFARHRSESGKAVIALLLLPVSAVHAGRKNWQPSSTPRRHRVGCVCLQNAARAQIA